MSRPYRNLYLLVVALLVLCKGHAATDVAEIAVTVQGQSMPELSAETAFRYDLSASDLVIPDFSDAAQK